MSEESERRNRLRRHRHRVQLSQKANLWRVPLVPVARAPAPPQATPAQSTQSHTTPAHSSNAPPRQALRETQIDPTLWSFAGFPFWSHLAPQSQAVPLGAQEMELRPYFVREIHVLLGNVALFDVVDDIEDEAGRASSAPGPGDGMPGLDRRDQEPGGAKRKEQREEKRARRGDDLVAALEADWASYEARAGEWRAAWLAPVRAALAGASLTPWIAALCGEVEGASQGLGQGLEQAHQASAALAAWRIIVEPSVDDVPWPLPGFSRYARRENGFAPQIDSFDQELARAQAREIGRRRLDFLIGPGPGQGRLMRQGQAVDRLDLLTSAPREARRGALGLLRHALLGCLRLAAALDALAALGGPEQDEGQDEEQDEDAIVLRTIHAPGVLASRREIAELIGDRVRSNKMSPSFAGLALTRREVETLRRFGARVGAAHLVERARAALGAAEAMVRAAERQRFAADLLGLAHLASDEKDVPAPLAAAIAGFIATAERQALRDERLLKASEALVAMAATSAECQAIRVGLLYDAEADAADLCLAPRAAVHQTLEEPPEKPPEEVLDETPEEMSEGTFQEMADEMAEPTHDVVEDQEIGDHPDEAPRADAPTLDIGFDARREVAAFSAFAERGAKRCVQAFEYELEEALWATLHPHADDLTCAGVPAAEPGEAVVGLVAVPAPNPGHWPLRALAARRAETAAFAPESREARIALRRAERQAIEDREASPDPVAFGAIYKAARQSGFVSLARLFAGPDAAVPDAGIPKPVRVWRAAGATPIATRQICTLATILGQPADALAPPVADAASIMAADQALLASAVLGPGRLAALLAGLPLCPHGLGLDFGEAEGL